MLGAVLFLSAVASFTSIAALRFDHFDSLSSEDLRFLVVFFFFFFFALFPGVAVSTSSSEAFAGSSDVTGSGDAVSSITGATTVAWAYYHRGVVVWLPEIW